MQQLRPEKEYAAVIGGVNIDIGGKPFQPLIPRDSNPGRVTASLGGVARNIAHNLSLLGIPVRFLTAFGDDVHALQIEASCAMLGIDIQDALKIPGESSSTYLFLNNERGDMELAISDMQICERIDAAYLAEKQAILDEAKLIVADTNIPEEALLYLAEHAKVPLFVDPVSVTKSKKLSRILGRIHTLKPNLVEAEALGSMSLRNPGTGGFSLAQEAAFGGTKPQETGIFREDRTAGHPGSAPDIRIRDKESCTNAAALLLGTGLTRAFISLGSGGVFAAERENAVYCPRIPASIRNTTGAGDAFMAALVYAYFHDMSLKETALFASTAAAMTIESIETVNPGLSPNAVFARMRGQDAKRLMDAP